MRVLPFDPSNSLLWQKLAASTEGLDLKGKGSPMPSGLPAISEDELTAVRLWIQNGAPATGVVPEHGGAARLVPPQARAASRRAARGPAGRPGHPALRAAVDDPASQRPGSERRERGLLLDLLQPHRPGSDRAVPRSAPGRSDEPDRPVLRLEPSAPAPVAQLAPQHHPHLHGRVPGERPELALSVRGWDRARRDRVRSHGSRRGGTRGRRLRRRLLPRRADPRPGLLLAHRLRSARLPGRRDRQRRSDGARFQRLAAAALRAHRSGWCLLGAPGRGHDRLELARLQRLRRADREPAVAEPVLHRISSSTRCRASSTLPTSSSRTCRPSSRPSTAARRSSGRERAWRT